jgi:hypothetical protein
LLAAFSLVYSENQEQKEEQQKDLKNLKFGQKSLHKVDAKEGMVSKKTKLVPLKRSQRYCFRTTEKMSSGDPKTWPHVTHLRLKDMKYEETYFRDFPLRRGCPQGILLT